jgi:HAD superfamily hydrolase (TIGR01484 family)
MSLPIKIISTDFDGTLFAEFENPPVPERLQQLIGSLQAQGVKWVINTGRDLSSLMETLGRAHLSVHPDYLVTVEREIYLHQGACYVAWEDWNTACTRCHETLFARIRPDLPRLVAWINGRFAATIYEDQYSPFCLIAENNDDADTIQQFLIEYCQGIPELTLVRNDVYARFSHIEYNKGKALAEVARLTGVSRDQIFVAGDHLNDLPMLDVQYARCLTAPANAISIVKAAVLRQGGYVSQYACGHGVADGLEHFLNRA